MGAEQLFGSGTSRIGAVLQAATGLAIFAVADPIKNGQSRFAIDRRIHSGRFGCRSTIYLSEVWLPGDVLVRSSLMLAL
jgi:hypothetical protein